MKKQRIAALTTALCLALSLTALPASAADDSTRTETIRALGIMAGDSSGDLNLSRAVSRAEFVTMMAAASPYKDTVGSGYGVSLFKDVKSTHWASEYIRLATEQGWMTGYVDGTFRPEQTITLEEACTALLRLLGYDSKDLAGSFPTAQLSKASALGLLDDVSAKQGQTLTRQSCVDLFYDLLTAESSTGAVYGTSLGYTVRNGEVDYATLVSADTKGPYVASSGGSVSLPFSATGVTVYRNGTASALSEVKEYDVYYYNSKLRTVWAYTDRVTGTLTGVSPSKTAPTAATVAGVSYSIGTSVAAYKLSSQGQFAQGDVVTLLLGMNGDVADVVSAQSSETVYYGVVVSSKKAASTGSTSTSSGASLQAATQVACTDGTVRTFYHSGSTRSAGSIVSVSTGTGGTVLTGLAARSLSGTVSASGTFAGYTLADGAEILDTDDQGGYARIYLSRLAGASLTAGNVRYYTLNAAGQIDRLILEDATGDTAVYAYVTSAERSSSGNSVSGSYTYLRDGQSYTLNVNEAYSVKAGGAILNYEDGQLKSMRQLKSVKVTALTNLTATADNREYQVSETVQVLLKDSAYEDKFYATTLSQINAGDYQLTGWYDDYGGAGGQIRILVATPK